MLKAIVHVLALLFDLVVKLKRRISCSLQLVEFAGVGKGCRIEAPMTIKGGRNITLGTDVRFGGPCYLYSDRGRLVVGSRCRINQNVMLAASDGTITIGEDVLIGPNVVIRAANHRTRAGQTISSQGHERGRITIGSDVWIGANVVVLAGADIGDGSVIGAGSGFNGHIEAGAIAVGSPARVKKHRTDLEH